MSEDPIKHMVNRFLGWRLPEDFHPDNGVSYARPNYAPEVDATPVGTNLFTATQAEAMVRHMIKGLKDPIFPPGTCPVCRGVDPKCHWKYNPADCTKCSRAAPSPVERAGADLEALAARCEAATPDQQRECLVTAWHIVHGGRLYAAVGTPEFQPTHAAWMRFSFMLDAEAWESAALMLVPAGLCWSIEGWPGGCEATVRKPYDDGEGIFASTPALALCAAALRALASLNPETGDGR